MDKANYISELYDNIKDDIEFDSDIIALEKLLNAMLNINVSKSITNWIYVVNKPYLSNIVSDVDLRPLTKEFPLKLIKKISFSKFMTIINSLEYNKELIYNALFDVFEENCGILEIITDFINSGLKDKEREVIYLVINNSNDYAKTVFDIMQFLKRIISLHLKKENKNINLLLEYTEIPNNLKDKSVLKSLLIDYICL